MDQVHQEDKSGKKVNRHWERGGRDGSRSRGWIGKAGKVDIGKCKVKMRLTKTGSWEERARIKD